MHDFVAPVVTFEECFERIEHGMRIGLDDTAPAPLVALVWLTDPHLVLCGTRAQSQTDVNLHGGGDDSGERREEMALTVSS